MNPVIFHNQKDITLELPESWELLGVLKPEEARGLENLREELFNAMKSPVGREPLTPEYLKNKKILIAVDDISRPTPVHLYFSEILSYLYRLGVKKSDISIIFALGIHREMRDDEIRNKLGIDNPAGIRILNHKAHIKDELVFLGKTSRGTEVALNRHIMESDLIICVGAIEPHLLLGFGGGLKMIIPGLAADFTIAQNHMQGVSAEKYNYIGEYESPMRLDLEEGAMMSKKDFFIINAIMNSKLEICRFMCGDPVKAHREGIKFAEKISCKQIREKADVIIVSSAPMNADLRQGMKCIGNCEQALKDNGLIIGFLECRNGIGDISVPKKSIPNYLLRKILRLIGSKRVMGFIDRVKKGAGIEERFLAHFSMQVVRKNQIFVYSENLPPDTGKRLGLFRQFNSVEDMIKAAGRYAPRNARVYIFPYGGATYPSFSFSGAS